MIGSAFLATKHMSCLDRKKGEPQPERRNRQGTNDASGVLNNPRNTPHFYNACRHAMRHTPPRVRLQCTPLAECFFTVRFDFCGKLVDIAWLRDGPGPTPTRTFRCGVVHLCLVRPPRRGCAKVIFFLSPTQLPPSPHSSSSFLFTCCCSRAIRTVSLYACVCAAF